MVADAIIALILLAISAGVYWESGRWPSDVFVGSAATMPRAAAGILALLAFSLLAGWRKGLGAVPGEVGTAAELRRIAAATAATVAYIELLEPVGFILCTAGLIFALQWLMGQRRWAVLASVSVAFPVVCYLLFGLVLAVPLPDGLLVWR